MKRTRCWTFFLFSLPSSSFQLFVSRDSHHHRSFPSPSSSILNQSREKFRKQSRLLYPSRPRLLYLSFLVTNQFGETKVWSTGDHPANEERKRGWKGGDGDVLFWERRNKGLEGYIVFRYHSPGGEVRHLISTAVRYLIEEKSRVTFPESWIRISRIGQMEFLSRFSAFFFSVDSILDDTARKK